MHLSCTVQPLHTPDHLKQDLAVVKRHLEAMQNYTLISEVAEMVENFTPCFEVFFNSFKDIESEVKAVIDSRKEEEYNSVKDRIKE